MNLHIPILMYHEIVKDATPDLNDCKKRYGKYFLGAMQFDRHLAALRDNGLEVLSLSQLYGLLFSSPAACDAEKRYVVITFDDGYLGNYDHALPLLEKYGFTATFFITTGKIGAPLMMESGHLKKLVSNGMSVQSHTVSHPFMRKLSFRETFNELHDSKKLLEDTLGVPVDFISLPNGSYNGAYAKTAEDCGYKAGCCSMPGFNDKRTPRFLLRRFCIHDYCVADSMIRLIERGNAASTAFILASYGKEILKRIIGEDPRTLFYR